ncbi:MAG: alpha/beta hydrolase [Oscillospiraceae bacterium]|nr:alpha/beta hydrolase [Oscillospiraceae bacterium]
MMGYLLAAIFVVLVLGLSYGCYWVAFYNPESRHKEAVVTMANRGNVKQEALNEKMERTPYERVSIRSEDGLLLSARYYHLRDGAPLHIQFHGYRGSGVRDFSAGNDVVRRAGYNTLVVDQRAHGLSQGNTMTFGILERYDCLAWARYALQRFGPETAVFLSGVSMGAATVLMASNLDLPGNVVGIIGDCPYSSPRGIIRKICRDIHIPWALVSPFMTLGALVFGRFRLGQESAVSAVKEAKIPVLLIHGKEDRYILPEMSEQIRSNCASECYLEIFPGAGHGGSCLTDTPRYERVVRSFCGICLDRWEARKEE